MTCKNASQRLRYLTLLVGQIRAANFWYYPTGLRVFLRVLDGHSHRTYLQIGLHMTQP